MLFSQIHDWLLKGSDVYYFCVSHMQLLPSLGNFLMSQEPVHYEIACLTPEALRRYWGVILSLVSGVIRS